MTHSSTSLRSAARNAIACLAVAIALPAVCLHAQEPLPSTQRTQMHFPAPTPNDTLQSVEVSAEGKVRFRIWAPNATDVKLQTEGPEATPGIKPDDLAKFNDIPLVKGDQGIWETTIGPIMPGVYLYNFVVDGVKTPDPRNPISSQTLTAQRSVYEVPGAEFSAYKPDVPHGDVHVVYYNSKAVGNMRRLHVYTPPGYENGTKRYPVLYLLHGDEQPASSFLRLGLQPTLDRLIDSHAIRPLIAVMLSGAGAPQNWLNTSGPRYYSYIGEVQRLTDRVLPTIPDRAARAIAGYSMGGFGAMNVALTQLSNYSVVESWEGQFANLGSELAADRPLLARLPLHAFVWGGEQDTVVGYAADAPWAAAMRAAGAQATSAVYPGAHAFAPIAAHLAAMLSFAGRALRS